MPFYDLEHKIKYLGSKQVGFRWKCSCGASSGDEPFDDSFLRTESAEDHMNQFDYYKVRGMWQKKE